MSAFDEPRAGKGKTPMENAYLAFVDERRSAKVNWSDIPSFRDWVEAEYARLTADNDAQSFEEQDAAMMAHLAEAHPNWATEPLTADQESRLAERCQDPKDKRILELESALAATRDALRECPGNVCAFESIEDFVFAFQGWCDKARPALARASELISPIPQVHTLVNTGKPIRYVLADDYTKLEQELSAAKAAHGETLLLLNKAAFETIPKLEQEAAALREHDADLGVIFEKYESQLARYRAPVSEMRRTIWHEDWKPIINAIGEISVQEAMDAIERSL